jgi:hypothetical protein
MDELARICEVILDEYNDDILSLARNIGLELKLRLYLDDIPLTETNDLGAVVDTSALTMSQQYLYTLITSQLYIQFLYPDYPFDNEQENPQ